ncbi:MAG: leucine-rich repeat protein [Crocinitomix sp.]|nr:leucine-rich repeat protein [Crocinitomix sp.]
MNIRLLSILFIILAQSTLCQIGLGNKYTFQDTLTKPGMTFSFDTGVQKVKHLSISTISPIEFVSLNDSTQELDMDPTDYIIQQARINKLGYFSDAETALRAPEKVTHLSITDLNGEEWGEIKKSLHEFDHLEELSIYTTGDFELPEAISQNKSLVKLTLYAEKMQHLPDSIIFLENLEVLEIHQSPELKILPQNFQELSQLKRLQLSCGIEKIDSSIFQMKGITSLNLSHSNISEIPTRLYLMTNLKELNLSYTQISHISSDITFLDALTELDLYETLITEIPRTLYYCRNLELLIINSPKTKEMEKNLYRIRAKSKLRIYLAYPDLDTDPSNYNYSKGDARFDMAYFHHMEQMQRQEWRHQQHVQYIQQIYR